MNGENIMYNELIAFKGTFSFENGEEMSDASILKILQQAGLSFNGEIERFTESDLEEYVDNIISDLNNTDATAALVDSYKKHYNDPILAIEEIIETIREYNDYTPILSVLPELLSTKNLKDFYTFSAEQNPFSESFNTIFCSELISFLESQKF